MTHATTPAPLKALMRLDSEFRFDPEAREILMEAWEGRDIIAPLASEARRSLLAASVVSSLLARKKGETALIIAPTTREAQRIFKNIATLASTFQMSGTCLTAGNILGSSVRQTHDFAVTTLALFSAARESLAGFLPRATCLVLTGYERLRSNERLVSVKSLKDYLGDEVQTIIALDEYEPVDQEFERQESADSQFVSTSHFISVGLKKSYPVLSGFAKA